MPDDDAPDRAAGPAGADQGEREGDAPAVAPSPASLAEPVPLAAPTAGIAFEAPPPASSPADAYERRARLAEDRLSEVLAAYRKLKTDNEAYRTRLTKNLDRRFEQRRERLLLKFIDILDNLDRALGAAETTYTGEPMIEGLILVRTQLLQTLQDEGLERIPVLGLPYDPATSEAVQTQPVEDAEHHHLVVKELLRGYRLKGRIARPASVVVGEHHPKSDGAEAEAVPVAEPVATAVPVGGPAKPHRGKGARRRAAEVEPPLDDDPAPDDPTGEPTLEEIIARAEAQEARFSDFVPVDGETPTAADAEQKALQDDDEHEHALADLTDATPGDERKTSDEDD